MLIAAGLVAVMLLGTVLTPVAMSTPTKSTSTTSVPAVNVNFSAFQRFTARGNNDFNPRIFQSSDGRAWIFWQTAPISTPWLQDIHYEVYNWTAWSTEQVAVSSPGQKVQNVEPSVAQLTNGTLFLSFASNRTGNFDVFLKHYNPSTGWSAESQMTTSPSNDVVSSLVAASDGTLWLFWDRQSSITTNLYYKTYRNGIWSAETALTSDSSPVQDQRPSAFQTKDGRIWVAWSQVQDSKFVNIHIMYKTFNGLTWSSPVQVTFASDMDTHPVGMQDSNGTIWLSWARDVSYTCPGGGCAQLDILYITSTNNGATWSSEVNLTNDVGCADPNCFDDDHPSLTELKDGKLWLFWFTNRDPQSWWNLYYVNSSQIPIHNVAVTKVTSSPVQLRGGGTVTVNVTVANLGTYGETFELDVWATNTSTINIVSRGVYLDPSGSFTLSFTWITPSNLSGPPPGKYVISASIPPVANEYFTWDNNATGNRVWVDPPGDVDLDGSVTVADLGIVALAYHSVPGSPNWNLKADLNADGSVGIDDLSLVALWYHTVT
jgi:hypothetical protein